MTQRSVRGIREEDPLALLSAKAPVLYKKGAIIYSELKQATHIHLVIHGRVKVTRVAGDRCIVVDVYGRDELFGECALLDVRQLPEEALTLEQTEVMRWTKSEIEELVHDRPQLGVALMQTLVRRTIDFGARLQNCLIEKTAGRVLRALIRFAERSSAPGDAGSVYLAPLTHQLLAEYTGTTRENVTQHMNEFRRQGLLNYSRKGIMLTPRAYELAEHGSRGRAVLPTFSLDGTAA